MNTIYASAAALRGSTRHLSNCPSGGLSVACGDWEYGGKQFGNWCKAQEAGYKQKECWCVDDDSYGNCFGRRRNLVLDENLRGSNRNLSDCPSDGTAVVCWDGRPYDYDNMCLAELSGFSRDDCRDIRRNLSDFALDDDIAIQCHFKHGDPVVCGQNDETFANIWCAKEAGFTEEECEDERRYLSAFYDDDFGSMCIKAGDDPVVCGDNDEVFDNIWCARDAGFTENNCEDQRRMMVVMEDDFFRVDCSDNVDPVVCGGNNETFDNLCEAKNAGYAEEDCEDERRNLFSPCPKVFAPVVCDGNVYPNLCEAENAGFSSDDCEDQRRNLQNKFDDDFFWNTSQSDRLLNDEENENCQGTNAPVVCGADGKEFLNLCIAESEGFSESDCHDKRRDLVTVITSTTTNSTNITNTTSLTYATNSSNLTAPCTREYVPIVCGGVEYNNLCLAKQAGNSEDDCEADPFLDISFTIQIHGNLTDVEQPELEKFKLSDPLP